MQPFDLHDRSLAEAWVELHRTRATGSLCLARGRVEKRFGWLDGQLVSADSSLPREQLCAFLEAAGELTAEAAAAARELAAARGASEAAALAATKAVDPKRLLAAMRERIAASALEAFSWNDGRASFEPSPAASSAEARALRCEPLSIALSGIARSFAVDRIARDLQGDRMRKASASGDLAAALRRWSNDEIALLQLERALDGTRTLESVVGLVMREPIALAALWLAHRSGLLTFAEAEADARACAASEAASSGPQIEIEVVADGASAAGRKVNRPAAGAAAAASSAEADETRKRVLALYESLGESDHYALLGVPHDAKPAAIKKAYFSAAKQLHPDKVSRLGIEDLKPQVAEVFAALAEANEVLGDAKRRKEYDDALASGGAGGQVDVALLAQAESFFRKGEVLVKMGDFRGAAELLARAAQLWPSEAAYHALLGYAHFKKNPPDLGAARSALELAISVQDDDARAHMWLGLVLRAQGEVNEAGLHMAKARKLDPGIT